MCQYYIWYVFSYHIQYIALCKPIQNHYRTERSSFFRYNNTFFLSPHSLKKPDNPTVLQHYTFPSVSLFARLTFRTTRKTLEKSGF